MESFARLDAIFYYLANGSHQLGSSKIQMSSVGRAAKQYVLDMGMLYYVNSGKRRLVVRTPEERDRVLLHCMSAMTVQPLESTLVYRRLHRRQCSIFIG